MVCIVSMFFFNQMYADSLLFIICSQPNIALNKINHSKFDLAMHVFGNSYTAILVN